MAPELSPLRACPPAQAVSRERAPCEQKAVPGDHERLHSRRGVLELRFTAVRIECRIDQRTDASIRGIAVSPMDRYEHRTACDLATAVQPRDHGAPACCDAHQRALAHSEAQRIGRMHVDERLRQVCREPR